MKRKPLADPEAARQKAQRLRVEEGLTVKDIADRLGISESVASKLTAGLPSAHRGTGNKRRSDEASQAPRVSRYSHPPGHSETWGLLVRGTVLEGEPYP